MFTNFFQKFTVHEIMWKNTVELDGPQIIIWGTCIAFCIPKATNTCSEYVILIALPLQQWLHECAPMFHYMHFACLVMLLFAQCDNYFHVIL